jgi:hypothetical protein
MIRALPLAQAAVSLVSNGVNLSPSRFQFALRPETDFASGEIE